MRNGETDQSSFAFGHLSRSRRGQRERSQVRLRSLASGAGLRRATRREESGPLLKRRLALAKAQLFRCRPLGDAHLAMVYVTTGLLLTTVLSTVALSFFIVGAASVHRGYDRLCWRGSYV